MERRIAGGCRSDWAGEMEWLRVGAECASGCILPRANVGIQRGEAGNLQKRGMWRDWGLASGRWARGAVASQKETAALDFERRLSVEF